MAENDDELITLIARCALRDQTALKTLFERVGPYLNAVAYRILRSNDLSNDVLQEAFLQIWTNAASYRPHLAKPLTWMASITRYRALDRLDHERRRHDKLVSDTDTTVLAEELSRSEPDEQLAGYQLKFQLNECLATLSANIKESVELAYLQGYSRDEIAAKFNTSVNTVKSWLHRGAERLRLCLEAKQKK
jgi:RNA polymerase sigma-70 factor, ECF subfamily